MLDGWLDGHLMEGWMHKLLDGWRVGCPPLTCYEADPPQARVQCHLDLSGLILLQDNSLLHQQPVVRWHGNADQQQAAGPEHWGQQRQSSGAEGTHLGTKSREEQTGIKKWREIDEKQSRESSEGQIDHMYRSCHALKYAHADETSGKMSEDKRLPSVHRFQIKHRCWAEKDKNRTETKTHHAKMMK